MTVSTRARIRYAEAHDARAIAALHATALPGAFLSSLGTRPLAAMYRGLIHDPAAWVIVAEADRSIAGFIAGAADGAAAVRRNRIRTALAAGPALLRPATLRRAAQTGAYAPPAGLPRAELLSIAVADGARGMGIGARLIDALVPDLRASGADAMKVVVGAENEGAARFYERTGFTRAASIEVHPGEPSDVWVLRWRSR